MRGVPVVHRVRGSGRVIRHAHAHPCRLRGDAHRACSFLRERIPLGWDRTLSLERGGRWSHDNAVVQKCVCSARVSPGIDLKLEFLASTCTSAGVSLRKSRRVPCEHNAIGCCPRCARWLRSRAWWSACAGLAKRQCRCTIVLDLRWILEYIIVIYDSKYIDLEPHIMCETM